jgi:simple sugar transport system substrate-binding protein
MRSTRKLVRALATAATLAVALAACSSQGGAQNQPSQGGGGGGGAAAGKRYTVAMVTHEQAGDTFWDKIRAGAQDAAKGLNIELKYSNNENGPEQATLVQNAIDSKVDGLAVTLSNADAVIPVAKKAADAGIPVVVFNQGFDQYKQAGAKMYFGSDEDLAGQSIGQRISSDSGGKALCVIQQQGSVALETRCAGVKKTFANTENLYVNGADKPAEQASIGAKLQQDKAITHVVTLGAGDALAALNGKTDAGSNAKVVTFDLNPDAAKAIKDGKIGFSVDQQPYVQGYMAVTALWLSLTNGNDLGGGKPVLTGPSFVDSTNIDQILPYTASNKR